MGPRSSFEITPECLQARAWKRVPGLVHGFSTRHTSAEPFLARWGGGLRPVLLQQVHSDRIHTAEEAREAPERPPRGDALITGTPGLALIVKTADCLPVLLFDPQRRAAGAVHAGWRGTAARVVQKTVGAMRARFGCDPAAMRAVIGPGIQACCYEVGEEVMERFRAQFAYAEELFRSVVPENPADVLLPRQVMRAGEAAWRELRPAKAYLDLVEANRRQLIDAGLRPGHIVTGAPCTACRTDLLFSYRREGAAAGRLFGLIALTR